MTPDGGGGFSQAWQDISETPEVYAAVEQLSVAEIFRYRQIMSRVTHRFVIRYRADVTAGMRIVHDGVSHDIAAIVDRDGMKRKLEILAVKV